MLAIYCHLSYLSDFSVSYLSPFLNIGVLVSFLKILYSHLILLLICIYLIFYTFAVSFIF